MKLQLLAFYLCLVYATTHASQTQMTELSLRLKTLEDKVNQLDDRLRGARRSIETVMQKVEDLQRRIR